MRRHTRTAWRADLVGEGAQVHTLTYQPATLAATAPRLLCLPGTMCPPAVFEPLANLLGMPVTVAPWLEWDVEPGVPALAGAVARLLVSAEPTVLVGHSTGGLIALLSALRARAPDAPPDGRFGGLAGLVCDTGANMAGHGDVDVIIERVAASWGPPLWEAFARRCVERELAPGVLAALARYPARLDRDAVVRVLRSQRDTDLASALDMLELPVLVVHGARDQARELRYAEQLARGLPDARLCVLDCGHTPPIELPDQFAVAVRDWLAERVSGAGSR